MHGHTTPDTITLQLTPDEAALLLSLSRYVLGEMLRRQDALQGAASSSTRSPSAGGSGAVEGAGAHPPLLLTMAQAAEQLGIGRSTLYPLLRDGSIPSIHIGKSLRIPYKGLAEYIERQTREAQAAMGEIRAALDGYGMGAPRRRGRPPKRPTSTP